MATMLPISENGKLRPKGPVPELAYVWLSVPLPAQGDSIVVAQQEVTVQALSHQNETWSLHLFNAVAHTKGEETYLIPRLPGGHSLQPGMYWIQSSRSMYAGGSKSGSASGTMPKTIHLASIAT